MNKKRSLIEGAESKVGLKVQFFELGQRKSATVLGPLISNVQSGSISLAVTHHIGDSQLKLCIAMHTYMGLLLKIAGPHFEWNVVSECAQVSELGKRLLLCADLFEEYLERRIPLGWNDQYIYLESARITSFRTTLAVAVNKIRLRQRRYFVDDSLLSKDDVALLQRALNAALRWMARERSRDLNKRLGLEMRRTKGSITSYIRSCENSWSQATVLLVKVDVKEGHSPFLAEMAGQGDPNLVGIQTYLEFFRVASSYIAMLQKTWPKMLIAHLAKVTRSNQGAPQCVMLLFLQPELTTHSWKTKIQVLHADFNSQRIAKLHDPTSISATDLTQSVRKQSKLRTQQLIEDLFVNELMFRRLNLPDGRRSWSKGNAR